MSLGYIAIVFVIIFTTASQILIKIGSGKICQNCSGSEKIRSFFNIYIILGVILVLGASVFYIFALTKLTLNIAYSLTGFNYICVFYFGKKILKEETNSVQFYGVLMIFSGIVLWNLN